MGNQIYFKIAGQVYLAVLIIFTPIQISDIINGFWVITQKPAIFSNSGHVGWCTASPDTILKLDTLVMIQTMFVSIGLVVSEEKIFEKVYDVRRTTDGRRWQTPSDGNSSP
jgi:hypothetical protein